MNSSATATGVRDEFDAVLELKWLDPRASISVTLSALNPDTGEVCIAGVVSQFNPGDGLPERWICGLAGTDHATFGEACAAAETWARENLPAAWKLSPRTSS